MVLIRWILCAWLLNIGLVLGQNTPEALKRQAQTSEGVAKLRALNQLAGHYLPRSGAQAVAYAGQVLQLAPQMRKKGRTTHKGDPNYARKSIQRCEVDAHNYIGQAYEQSDQAQKAIRQYRQARQLATLIEYQSGANFAAERLSDHGKGASLNTIVLEKLNDLVDGAEKTAEREGVGEAFISATHDLSASSLEKKGRMAENKKEYARARDFYLRSLPYWQSMGDSGKITATYQKVAELEELLGNHQEARAYLALANSGTRSQPRPGPASPPDLEDAYADIRSLAEEGEGDSESDAVEEARNSQASILREAESLAEAGNIDASVAKIKEASAIQEKLSRSVIDSVENENFLENLNDQVKYLMQQQQLKDQELQQQRLFRNSLIITLALMLAIALLIGILFLVNRRAHRKLSRAYQDLEHTHQQLKSTQSQLVSAEKMASLGQLTAGIAHEINNPINFISGSVEPLKSNIQDLMKVMHAYDLAAQKVPQSTVFTMAKRLRKELEVDYLSEEIEELLDGIREGSHRTAEIVQGLRTFARMDEDQPKKFDLHDGIDSTLSLLKNQLDGVEIIKEYGPIPAIEGFPGKINQVLMNVLTNAIQAMPKGGWISIRTEQFGNCVEVRIQDTGRGISDQNRARIFEPFFTTKDVGEGTGLGLSISLGIIQQHNGEIHVNSMPGQGTEVVIQLPLQYQADVVKVRA